MSKVTFQESVMSSIEDLFQDNTLVSISGKAGTGKTSLSLFLVGKFLTSRKPYEGSCIWVQASELFSKKRLNSLFKNDTEGLTYLKNNVFVTPDPGPFDSYNSQLENLEKLSKNNYFLPPDIKFMVIDNISHHLRYEISCAVDFEMRSHIINTFYDAVLTPLIFRCQRENIILILIHEVSFNVESQKTLPFFSKLYKRLRGIHISLSKSFISTLRTMDVSFHNAHYSFIFNITDSGFTFSR
ncbi:MAG: hypothetical protein ACW96X_08085 [Promethearchaeota archaeon]|jgi:hypothetical protein